MTEKYPNFRTVGGLFLGALGLIGAVATYFTRFVSLPASWWAAWKLDPAIASALLVKRYGALLMVALVWGVLMFLPRSDRIPIRPSARRAAITLGLQVSSWLVITWISVWTGPTLVSYFAPLVSGVIVSALWLLWLTPASDVCGELIPVTAEEQEEYKAILNVLGPGQSVTRYIRLRTTSALRSYAAMQAGEEPPTR